jgi:hypothetical protein
VIVCIVSGLLLGGQIGYSFGESHALKHIVPHELAKISVVARKLPRTAEQSGVVLEVVVQNLTDSMQHVTQTDIEHTLMGPDEIVLADPPFTSTRSFDDVGSPASTWTAYEFGSRLLRPGQTRAFRFETSVAHEAERTGRVNVWTKSAVFSVPVRLTGDESSTSDDSEG